MIHKNSLTAPLLGLLLALLHFSLSQKSNHVEGTVGDDLDIKFNFSSSDHFNTNSGFSMYRDEIKIHSHPQSIHQCAAVQTQNICLVDWSPSVITLRLTHLTAESAGVYYLTVFMENHKETLILSNKVNLTLTEHPGSNTSAVSAPTCIATTNSSSIRSQSEMISRYICSTVVITLVLVLVVLLVWFCRIYRTKSDDTPALSGSPAQQGICPVSSTVPVVSCVEYGVLDFQKQPNRPERYSNPQASDGGVEYAAIMFPPRRKRT